jgi:protein XRP2
LPTPRPRLRLPSPPALLRSIFLRGSSSCKCIFIARQLRTRDCSGCDIQLLCRTRPIIESSTDMAFACFGLPYAGLAQQLKVGRRLGWPSAWGEG